MLKEFFTWCFVEVWAIGTRHGEWGGGSDDIKDIEKLEIYKQKSKNLKF